MDLRIFAFMSAKTKRIHALDALRAIMMLLGIVLHSSASYGEIDKLDEWGFLDPQNRHLIFDVFLGLIHLFRMPIFFVVSGFFGALLFYERSPRRMFSNRFQRIVLPFIAAMIVLTPFIYLCFYFAIARMNGVENAFFETWNSMQFSSFFPLTTSHLWFLYYLALLTFTTGGLALLLKKQKRITSQIRVLFLGLHKNTWLKVVLLALPIFALFHFMNAVDAYTSISIIPDWRTFVFYGIFYIYGWLLFKEKHLLQTFKKQYLWFIVCGLICFFIKASLYLSFSPEEMFYQIVICNSLGVWFLVFGLTGLFLTFFEEASARMRYISDASYWVYLVHLPVVIFIPGLLCGYDFSVFLKWGITLSVTTIFCFLTYKYFVRSTFIGKFLNGK